MYILSQDKTRIYNMSGHIEGIGYEESKDYKQRKTENIRHTIQVFDGCAEEIAEFKTKEDCMLVIYAIFKGMEQDSKAVEIPTQEEMEKQKDLIKQLGGSGAGSGSRHRRSSERNVQRGVKPKRGASPVRSRWQRDR